MIYGNMNNETGSLRAAACLSQENKSKISALSACCVGQMTGQTKALTPYFKRKENS